MSPLPRLLLSLASFVFRPDAFVAGRDALLSRRPPGPCYRDPNRRKRWQSSGTAACLSRDLPREAIVDQSALRLELEGQSPLGTDVRIVSATPSSFDETYHLLTGKASEVRNHYNALRVDLEETTELHRKLTIEARAYDDAVAFRYVLPEQTPIRSFRLTKEGTEFRIAKDATTYSLILPNFHSMYESEFVKLPISAFSNQGGVASKVLIGLPTLVEVPGVAWMAITEADLRGNSSMYLTNPSASWQGHWFESVIAPSDEDPIVITKGHSAPLGVACPAGRRRARQIGGIKRNHQFESRERNSGHIVDSRRARVLGLVERHPRPGR